MEMAVLATWNTLKAQNFKGPKFAVPRLFKHCNMNLQEVHSAAIKRALTTGRSKARGRFARE